VDPWALLSAVRAVEAFLEHRNATTLERARSAIARVDDISNHTYLNEGEETDAKCQLCGHDNSGDTRCKCLTRPVSENKSIFAMQPAFELLEEDLDFAIQETLTYSGFRTVLTEDFERDVHKTMTKLEKDPAQLDELTRHVRTIADIAHHYDKHAVHMKESVKSSYNKDPELAARSEAAMDAIKAKHKPLTEDAEEKAIGHAEKTKRISVRKLSSGPQLVKIAKRAAVELIAQKLANKPIKKISKNEKNVIIDAIKKKKSVVLKLAKKLIPRIKTIETDHAEHEHEEFGSAGS
jgi:hypothetical protein